MEITTLALLFLIAGNTDDENSPMRPIFWTLAVITSITGLVIILTK